MCPKHINRYIRKKIHLYNVHKALNLAAEDQKEKKKRKIGRMTQNLSALKTLAETNNEVHNDLIIWKIPFRGVFEEAVIMI